MTERTGQIVELQSLRGLAALVVLLNHVLTYLAVLPPWLTLVPDVVNAHAAVVLFFVLSGFVLTRSLRDRLRGTADLTAFYVKRVFRIYPALWAATLLGIAYIVWLHPLRPVAAGSPWFEHFYTPDVVGPRAYALAMAGTAHVLPPGWSIFIEILASAVLPLIAWALFRSRLVFAVIAAAAFAASFGIAHSPYGIATYFVDFVIGAALAGLPARVRQVLAGLPRAAAGLAFGLAAIVLVGLRSQWIAGYDDPALQLCEALPAAAMIALITYSPLDLPWLRSRAASWLGDISYSLYLFHFPLMCIASVVLGRILGPVVAPGPFALGLLGGTLASTLVVAALSYRYIELPGIALGVRAAALLRSRVGRAVPLAS